MNDISVLGGGAWGTALAAVMSAKGNDVIIYAREKDVVESVNNSNINKPFLPGVVLSKSLRATDKIEEAVKSKVVLITVPSQFFRGQLRQISKHDISPETIFVICTKGIDTETLALMSEIFEETLENQYAILSGPTFAEEVAKNMATSVSIASKKLIVAEHVKKIIQRDNFRVHVNNDVIGSQICGAIKNVIAVGCGVIRGLGQGENSRAAILTIGFHEIMRVNIEMGGKMETMMEPCGIGDLVLTCSSEQSRNFSFGKALGQGKASEYLEGKMSVVEGVTTSKAVVRLANSLNITLPLCEKIYDIIEGKAPPTDILTLV
jgi:glycerol-3-phosphate dehydrogenase (NAD(P)+)